MDKLLEGLKLAAAAMKLALSMVADKVPAAAEAIAEAIAALDAAIAGEDLLALLNALNVPKEVLNIVQFKFDPKIHPSDGAA